MYFYTQIGVNEMNVRKPFKCADGSTVSVQGSAFHYCTPRADNATYTEVEVMVDNAPESWEIYDAGDDGVYANVPLTMVAELIAARGGLDFADALHFRKMVY